MWLLARLLAWWWRRHRAPSRRRRWYVAHSLARKGRRDSMSVRGCVLPVVDRRLRRPWRGSRHCGGGARSIYLSVFPSIGESRRCIEARAGRQRLLRGRGLALYGFQLAAGSPWCRRRWRHSSPRAGYGRDTIGSWPCSRWRRRRRRRRSPVTRTPRTCDASRTSIHRWHRGRR